MSRTGTIPAALPASDPSPRVRGCRIRGATAGMTMVEVCVSMIVLLVAIGGTLSTISGHLVLGASARETAQAYMEAQRLIERLKAEDFPSLFARYNATPVDDPAGSVSPGAHFDVAGLAPWTTDADGRVGKVSFPVDEDEPERLREDLEFNGRTLDLNADGSSDSEDRSNDFVLLPVRVRVAWKGRSGNRFVELQTILSSP